MDNIKNYKNKFIIPTLAFIAALMFYCYEFFLRILTGTFQKQIVSYFHLHHHFSFSFLVSSYSFTYLVMQIPCGILLDYFKTKYILPIAILICGFGNIIFMTPNYDIAIIGRLMVGFGSAFAFVGILKISREYFPKKYFVILASFAISIGTLTAIFSNQVSVLILNTNILWNQVFIFSGLFSIPLAIFVYYAFSFKSENYAKVLPNISLNSIASIFKNKLLITNALWGGFLYIPTVILTTQYGTLYFQTLFHLNQFKAVEATSFLLLGWVLFSPIFSFLSIKVSSLKIVSFVFIVLIVMFIFMAFSYNSISYFLMFFIFLLGCLSAVQVLVWKTFKEICPFEYTAIGVAATNMIITGVTELGQLLSGKILDLNGLISSLKNASIIKYGIQLHGVLFILSTIIGFTVFLYVWHKTNNIKNITAN